MKKLFILLITVFAFSFGVHAGNEFMDFIFKDYNETLAINQEVENSLANDEKSPDNEIKNTNEIILANNET